MKSRYLGRSVLVFSLIVLVGLAACGFCTASANDNGFIDGPVLTDQPLVVDGGWYIFQFGGAGSFNFEGAFLFTTSGLTQLKVTDAFCKGDQFKIYDNGVPIVDTSVVPAAGECPPSGNPGDTDDPDVAYADPTYSHGAFSLGPGSHAITIQVTVSPFGGGGAFLRVDSSAGIPAFSTWGLFAFFSLLVFCAVWFMRRERISFTS